MPRLSITEKRELRTLSSVATTGDAGAAVVHRAGSGEIAGATAQALEEKGFVTVVASSPRRAILTEAGRRRLDALATLI